jgi:DNA-binding CsgD family transcriptional regulator
MENEMIKKHEEIAARIIDLEQEIERLRADHTREFCEWVIAENVTEQLLSPSEVAVIFDRKIGTVRNHMCRPGVGDDKNIVRIKGEGPKMTYANARDKFVGSVAGRPMSDAKRKSIEILITSGLAVSEIQDSMKVSAATVSRVKALMSA